LTQSGERLPDSIESVRWVASRLGHANPELTLRVYAHAVREEETDISFLELGGAKLKRTVATKKPLRATPR